MASPPQRRFTVPHTFFTDPVRAASGPGKTCKTAAKSAAKARPSARTIKTAPLSTATSTKASVLESKAVGTVLNNPEIASTSETACFLGLAAELRCMIYNHLWTQDIDVCIISAGLDPPSTPIHPIFHVNRQIREEAIDRIHKDQNVTLHLHAAVYDLDFRKLLTVLRKLGNKYFRRDGGMLLHVSLGVRSKDLHAAIPEPESLGKMLGFMRKYDLEWECKVIGYKGCSLNDAQARLETIGGSMRSDPWAFKKVSCMTDAILRVPRWQGT